MSKTKHTTATPAMPTLEVYQLAADITTFEYLTWKGEKQYFLQIHPKDGSDPMTINIGEKNHNKIKALGTKI